MSQIGEDDYRSFIFYSTLFRHKWTLPAYILAPIILSVLFAFDGGQFYSGNLYLSLIVLYAALVLIVFQQVQLLCACSFHRGYPLQLSA